MKISSSSCLEILKRNLTVRKSSSKTSAIHAAIFEFNSKSEPKKSNVKEFVHTQPLLKVS